MTHETAEETWKTYTSTWSITDGAKRDALLARLLTQDVEYTDPLTTTATRDALRAVQRAAGYAETGKCPWAAAYILLTSRDARGCGEGDSNARHANIETTERYLHSDRAQEREAMRLLSTPALTSGAANGQCILDVSNYLN